MREFLLTKTTPFRLGRRHTVPVELDAADLGTAFGLDLSMAPEDPVETLEAPASTLESAPVGW